MIRCKRSRVYDILSLLATACLLTSPFEAADVSTSISGTVTAWTKYPRHLQGVPITIQDDRGEITETFTDKEGRYLMFVEPSRSYRISISYKSYCHVHRPTVRVESGDQLTFDFDLLLCLYGESFDGRPVRNIVPYHEDRIPMAADREAIIVYGSRTDDGAETRYGKLQIPFHPEVGLPIRILIGRYTIQADSALLDDNSLQATLEGRIAISNGTGLETRAEPCVTFFLKSAEPKLEPCNR